MCTVTYLPVVNNQYILTSNRDEDVARPAAIPFKEYKVNNASIYYPQDPQANGTWIAHNPNGYTLCLLNGGYEKHTPKNNYRKSRGLVLLDFFNYNNPKEFVSNYNFEGIEPFTLLMVYACTQTQLVQLYELKWDEKQPTVIAHDGTLPHIWSSVTLYSTEIVQLRKQWFNEWLHKNENYTPNDILFFHHFGGEGELTNDLIINRGNKKTVSVSCIHKQVLSTEIIYEDIVNQQLQQLKLISC